MGGQFFGVDKGLKFYQFFIAYRDKLLNIYRY